MCATFAARLHRVGLNSREFIVAVCLAAFLLRFAIIFVGSTYRIAGDDTQNFGFGWEMGRVAASLAEGHGFASPLPLPTGPTTIVGPVYPFLLAGVFKLFGVYTTNSAIFIRVLQSLFSSLTCLFIYLSGRDSLDEMTGRIAAIAWAIFPLNIFFTVDRVWETSLTSLLAAALFWYMLTTFRSLSVWRWCGLGLLLGLAALTSASLVLFVIPFGLRALWINRARAILPATTGALLCLAVAAPWIMRNHAEFGKYILRDNFPLEFRVGNNLASYGQKIEDLHPSNNPAVNLHWQSVGELQFMQEESQANAEYIAGHHGRFAIATLNRIVNYWTGAWLRTIPGVVNSLYVVLPNGLLTLLGFWGVSKMFRTGCFAAFAYAGCLFLYPLPYYVTTTQPRFYHAVTPLLILGAAYCIRPLVARLPGGQALTGERAVVNHADSSERVRLRTRRRASART